MYADSGAWHALMEKFVRGATVYLNDRFARARSGAGFDSWVGCLSPAISGRSSCRTAAR